MHEKCAFLFLVILISKECVVIDGLSGRKLLVLHIGNLLLEFTQAVPVSPDIVGDILIQGQTRIFSKGCLPGAVPSAIEKWINGQSRDSLFIRANDLIRECERGKSPHPMSPLDVNLWFNLASQS